MARDEKKPAIRFDGFTDPWEQRELLDVVDVRSGQDYKHLSIGDIPVYGTGGYMLSVDKALSYSEDAIGIGRKGTIDKPYLLRAPFWTVDTLFFTVPRYGYNLEFTHSVFQRINWKRKDESTGVPSLSKTTINDIGIFVPKLVEQKHIGDFFAKIDNLITLHQRKCDKLISVKKSMLEKMFPQKGAKVPEIRFAGFTDPWEQRKLGELSEPLTYGLNAASTEFDGINKYIRITDIDDETRMFKMDGLTSPVFQPSESDKYKMDEGDLLFARTGASVGKTYIYRHRDGLVYFAGFLIRARIKPDYVADFVFQNTLTERYKQFIQITSQRSGQPGVNAQEYESFSFLVPKKEEQKLIGTFFNQMDNLITLHQRKLEKLKNIKKSLLEKMFV